jgi:hypothetical protein
MVDTHAFMVADFSRRRSTDSTMLSNFRSLCTEVYDHVWAVPILDGALLDYVRDAPCDVWSFFHSEWDHWECGNALDPARNTGLRNTVTVDVEVTVDDAPGFTMNTQHTDTRELVFPAYPHVPIIDYDNCGPRDYALWISANHRHIRLHDSTRTDELDHELLPALYSAGVTRLVLVNGKSTGEGIRDRRDLAVPVRAFETTWVENIPRLNFHNLLAGAAAFVISDPTQHSMALPYAVAYGVPIIRPRLSYPGLPYEEYNLHRDHIEGALYPGFYRHRAMSVRHMFDHEACIRRVISASSVDEEGNWES